MDKNKFFKGYLNRLSNHYTTIDLKFFQIKLYRQNLYAHFDKKYFDDPNQINEDTNLNFTVIDRVLENAHQILFKIHAGYRDTHRKLKIYSRGDIKRVVNNLRIFNNWKNNPKVRALLMKGCISL